MCLKIPKKANRNIVCYKWLTKHGDSPALTSSVKTGAPENENFPPLWMQGLFGPCIYGTEKNLREIGKGVIHAFTNAQTAKAKRPQWYPDANILYECVIPKGTRYWISKNGTEIFAKKLIFKREIKRLCV